MNKIGVVITTHGNAGEITQQNIESVIKYIPNSHIILFNNESTDTIIENIPLNYPFIDYFYIKDQKKNNGLTGTWNSGIKKCLEINCDIVILLNNDLIINESIENVISTALKNKNNPYYYGVISDNPGHSSKFQHFRPINQYLVNNNNNPISFSNWKKLQDKNKKEYIDKAIKDGYLKKNQPIKFNYGTGIYEMNSEHKYINGFCLVLTKTILNKNKLNESEYFSNYYPFQYNDQEWYNRIITNNSKAFIDTNTWVKHYKYNSWKKLNYNK